MKLFRHVITIVCIIASFIVRGGAKLAENRRLEIPVATARKSLFVRKSRVDVVLHSVAGAFDDDGLGVVQ